MQQRIKSVRRQIHFHRINIGLSDDHASYIPFDPEPGLAKIGDLVSTQEWYDTTAVEDGEAICILPETTSHKYPVARLCRVRRLGLPQLERQGRITNLDIAEDQGLMESIHVVFFPDNIVGFEYNHYGPRISRLLPYFKRKADLDVQNPKMRPIARQNILDQLDSYQRFSNVAIEVDPPASHLVERMVMGRNTITQELKDLAQVNPDLTGPKLYLELKAKRRDEEGLFNRAIGSLTGILQAVPVRVFVTVLRCTGRRSPTATLDPPLNLLWSYITAEENIPLSSHRGRALSTNGAYSAVVDAYNDLKEELDNLPSVDPVPDALWRPSC